MYKELINEVEKEINTLDEIIGILSDDNSVVDSDDVNLDLMIMKTKRNSFQNFKSMLLKASLKIEGVDNEKIMTAGEKKIFYKLVKIIAFIRKVFRIK